MATGLRLKPPGQSTEITEERSSPALTPETYSHSGHSRVWCVWMCVHGGGGVTLPVCSVPPLFCWEYIQCEPRKRWQPISSHDQMILQINKILLKTQISWHAETGQWHPHVEHCLHSVISSYLYTCCIHLPCQKRAPGDVRTVKTCLCLWQLPSHHGPHQIWHCLRCLHGDIHIYTHFLKNHSLKQRAW